MTPQQITHSTPPAWAGNEYSSCNPFNCDNTRLLLVKVDHFGLYDGAGNFLKDLPIAASQEPRWSRTNPELFYYLEDNQLWQCVTEQAEDHSIVHAFTEYATISGKGESDLSVDGDHLVLCGTDSLGRNEVFVYSLKNGKGQTFPQTLPIDGLKIDSKNRIILSRSDGIWVVE